MTAQSTLLDALSLAMTAEKKAAEFYRSAAEKATSPRGKNMLEQLAKFETAHYQALDELRRSLEGGGRAKAAYAGTEFEPVPTELTGAAASKETNLNGVYDVLKLAIDAESGAHDRYEELAEQAEDDELRAFFKKLAEEETLHRRILSDEFYQLNNSGGQWVWME